MTSAVRGEHQGPEATLTEDPAFPGSTLTRDPGESSAAAPGPLPCTWSPARPGHRPSCTQENWGHLGEDLCATLQGSFQNTVCS